MAVWTPCICGDEIVTVTPGNTLSELSTTLPLIEPVVAPTVWPSAATGSSRAMSKTPRMFFITRLLIAPPEAGQDNAVASEAEPQVCWSEAQPRGPCE